MTHDFLNWMALVWLAAAVAYLSLFNDPQDGDADKECPRRGCRRTPAGQGCNHAGASEGPLARLLTEED